MRIKPKDYDNTFAVVECRESIWRSHHKGEVNCYMARIDLPFTSDVKRAIVIQSTIARLQGLYKSLEPKSIQDVEYDIIDDGINAFGATYINRYDQDKWQLQIHLKDDLDYDAFKTYIKQDLANLKK